MTRVFHERVEPKAGLAVEVSQGNRLRITDVEGKQVVDMVAFNLEDHRVRFSTSYTRNRYFPTPDQLSYYPHSTVTVGDWLMSGLCRPMMTMTADTPEPKGVHGLYHRMCNRFFYEVFGPGPRDGCFEIISDAVESYGIAPHDLPDSIDLFMNYPFDCELGHFDIKEPVSRPGDYVEFRAEINCLVAMSNCPEDAVSVCNGGLCTPVMVEIFEDASWEPRPILAPGEWLDRELDTFRRTRSA